MKLGEHQHQLHLFSSGEAVVLGFFRKISNLDNAVSFFSHSGFPITGKGLLIKQPTFQYLSNNHVHFSGLLNCIVQSAAISLSTSFLGVFFTLLFYPHVPLKLSVPQTLLRSCWQSPL
jgi:hypothetical protein